MKFSEFQSTQINAGYLLFTSKKVRRMKYLRDKIVCSKIFLSNLIELGTETKITSITIFYYDAIRDFIIALKQPKEHQNESICEFVYYSLISG